MTWENVLKRFGFAWAIKDYFYKMFSNKPEVTSVQNYLKTAVYQSFRMKGSQLPEFSPYTYNRDKIVLKCFEWVAKNIRYAQDTVKWKEVEVWEDLDNIVATKQSDCEGMATLLFSMCRSHQINPLQIRFVCGNIRSPKGLEGHAWVEYQADSTGKWHILDPSYYPQNITDFKYRRTVEDCKEYEERWFSLTDRWY